MVNCSFCDGAIGKGTGLMYVKRDGTLYYFCGSKCRKNSLSLSREGRRQKWTEAGKKFRSALSAKKAVA